MASVRIRCRPRFGYWPPLSDWLLILIGFLFFSHLLLFAADANWWNDPAFLPTSPAGGQ